MNKRNVLRHLKKALLIIKEVGWCQKSLAINLHGASVRPESPFAIAWCAIGALDVSAGRAQVMDTECFLKANLPKPFGTVHSFNDHSKTKKKDVVKLFNKCISKLQSYDVK